MALKESEIATTNYIYDKTTYVQSQQFTQALQIYTSLIVGLMIFSMSVVGDRVLHVCVEAVQCSQFLLFSLLCKWKQYAVL